MNHPWSAEASPVLPFSSDQLVAMSGYILNNQSSNGSVQVSFFRGGIDAPALPFQLIVQPGEYKSFTIVGVDTVQIDPSIVVATGEINITVNFQPY